MKLWLLQQKGDWWESHGEVFYAIVRAETEDAARKWGGNFYLKEGYSIWYDPERSTCTELTSDGEAGEVWIFDTVMNLAYEAKAK